MIKFTIITITYNAEKALPSTVDSVLAQTYPHIEHLIIDGASTDGTLDVAKDYMQRSYAASNGHDVRITSEPDNGLYDAMNKGLAQASGDYLVFLNAGDFLPHPDVIEQVIKGGALETTPSGLWPAVLYGDTDIVDGDGHFLCHRHLSPPKRLTWRSFIHGMLVCHQAFYARTDIARQVAFDRRYRYSADVDWCIRVMKEGARRRLPMRNVNAVVVNYLQEGQTTLHHKESLHERYQVMCEHYGRISTVLMHGWFAVRALKRKLFTH